MSNEDVFRDMEGSEVVDKNGLYVGKIVDFTFKDFKLEQFVVKGNNGVLQEHFDIKGDYHLLIHHDKIRRKVKNEVHISISSAELSPIQDIGDDENRFVVMRNVEVVAKDGETLGNIIDGVFHRDNHFSLIIGGTPFQLFLDKIGITSDKCLFVPYRYVNRFDANLIQLDKNRDDLREVFNDIDLDSDGLKLREQQKLSSKESRMTLYNESVKDVLSSGEIKT